MNKLSYKTYLDKVYGCFLGKTVVGTLGAPFEGIKMPLELPFRREMIDAMLPNDDLDLQVLWLDAVEKYGAEFTAYDLQKIFVENCDYSPGEYAIMRKNYERGIYPPLSGSFCNDFYINGMGCPIRSEIWACLAPGDEDTATKFAMRDGILDHEGDSVYAELFFSALESAAFYEDDLEALIEIGLKYVPQDTRIYRLICDTVELCKKYDNIKLILRKILKNYGHPDCTNLYQNIGITIAALILGNLDIIKTGMDALNCGFDTDCTCATAGAVIGVIRGAQSLITEYNLGEVKYVLGVRSNRRSDSVKDLSEDIAIMGVKLNPDRFTDCPKVETAQYRGSSYPLSFEVRYENNSPVFTPDTPCVAELLIKNISDSEISGSVTLCGMNCDEIFPASIPAGQTISHTVTISADNNDNIIWDKNIINVKFNSESLSRSFSFGAVGATMWKAIGPIWRTDPICNTELLQNANLAYWNLFSSVKYDGDMNDVVRRFHLNFAPDTETEYKTFDECFTPLCEDKETEYEEFIFNQTSDSFTMDDICSFYGPSVIYLAKEMVCPEDMTVCVQIGHSSPFALYINNEKIAQKDVCDTWDAENVHIQNIKLNKGINRVLMRLTRVNADAKYSLIFSEGATCSRHHVCFGTVNPHFFGQQ